MMSEDKKMEITTLECGEEVLKKLLHLKRYETPEVSRMTRNKQNIMRHVREASRNRRKSVGDVLEINFPWFFAEPKYGVALLFVAFAALQYVGVNARHAAQSNTGIYTMSAEELAAYGQADSVETNSVDYPEIPSGMRLFQNGQVNDQVKWVTNPSPTWQQ